MRTARSLAHVFNQVVIAPRTHSFECEVTLEDHLSDLCEDGALGVGQIHLPDACVSHTALVLVLGLARLIINQIIKSASTSNG